MMCRRIILVFLCCIVVGCSFGVDKRKFENLYRSAKAIEGATAVGVNYQKFGELLQNFATEISIARDQVKSKKEKEMLTVYFDALTIYKDSATLWEQNIRDSGYSFVPSGRIFVGPSMGSVIEKYKLAKQTHILSLGGSSFETISESAIQLLLEIGRQKIDEANSLFLNSKPQKELIKSQPEKITLDGTFKGIQQKDIALTGWVNDFAGVIDSTFKNKISSLISELEKKTSAEIAVVVVDSISPYDEKEYARMLFNKWGIGKKGKDNGVLVLVAIRERRWRIETGYGIENVLSDQLCGEIGNKYMVPYLKEGKYGEALYNGVSEITKVILQSNSKGNILKTKQIK